MKRVLRPLSRPLFRRFFVGQAVSRTGDFVFFVALPWQVVLLGGAENEIGVLMATFFVAQLLLTLLGGVIVDRVSRKRIVVASDVAQCAMVALAAAFAFAGAMSLALLLLFAVAWGAAQAVAFPALGAFLPETVPKEDLQAANSLYQGATLGAAMVGSVLSGLLVATFGIWSAFAFDAVTFAVSAALLGTLPSPPPAPRAQARKSVRAEVREGWAYVARIPWLWIAIALFAVINAAEASPRNVVLPVLVGVDLGGGVVGVGLVAAAFMGGWLAGSLIPSLRPDFKRPGVVAYKVAGISGLAVLLVGFSNAVWQVAALYFVHGVAFGVFGVIWSTSVAKFVDERIRGRVISIDTLGSFGLIPVSAALVGFAAAAFGASVIFLAGGAVVLACAAVGLVHGPAHHFGPAPAAQETT